MSQQEVLDVLKASGRPLTAYEIMEIGWPSGNPGRITAICYSLTRLERWGFIRRAGTVTVHGRNNQDVTRTQWEVVQ